MKRIRTIITLGLAVLLAGAAWAGNLGSAARPLQVTILQEPANFADPFYSAYVTAGELKFTFIVPQGFRLTSDPATGRLVLGNREGDRTLSLALLGAEPADASEVNDEACRAFVLRMHPEGRITGEFPAGAAGRSGHGFDVQWKVGENLYECQRIALIPTAFGTFIFSATTGRNHFADAQSDFTQIITTFRASTNGKFDPAHIDPVN
jgi:hypothetical protein